MTDATELDAAKLAAYLALKEVGSILEHAVEQQLREDGGISGPQFQIMMRLRGDPAGQLRMTDLADSLVYSRSGLTYQAAQLEKAGLIIRRPAEDDERSTLVELTDAGLAVLDRVLPGHIEVVNGMMLNALSNTDIAALSDILGRVRDQMRRNPPRSAAPRSERGSSPRSTG